MLLVCTKLMTNIARVTIILAYFTIILYLQHSPAHARYLSIIAFHSRTGRRGEGGCSPPKFWATQIFWAARENLGKASFLRRFHVLLLVF